MRLTHGRVELELHLLREAPGLPLLLLHELGGEASQWKLEDFEAWPGPIHALDFPGHGVSDRLIGGGYAPEYFLADADIALHAIDTKGRCALAGAGLGGYVAMLLAAARKASVPGALILPGRGLAGGGLLPDWSRPTYRGISAWDAEIAKRAARYRPGTDPMVAECESDIRPEDYVRPFAEQARNLILSEAIMSGADVPRWWSFAVESPHGQRIAHDFGKLLAALREACNEENASS